MVVGFAIAAASEDPRPRTLQSMVHRRDNSCLLSCTTADETQFLSSSDSDSMGGEEDTEPNRQMTHRSKLEDSCLDSHGDTDATTSSTQEHSITSILHDEDDGMIDGFVHSNQAIFQCRPESSLDKVYMLTSPQREDGDDQSEEAPTRNTEPTSSASSRAQYSSSPDVAELTAATTLSESKVEDEDEDGGAREKDCDQVVSTSHQTDIMDSDAVSAPVTISPSDKQGKQPRTRVAVAKPILKHSETEIPIRNKGWKSLPKANLSQTSQSFHQTHASYTTITATRRTPSVYPRQVRFTAVVIRTYDQCVGDNPAVSYGTPIQLDWTYEQYPPIVLDVYETTKLEQGLRRPMKHLGLNYYQRRNILIYRFGYSEEELVAAEKAANKIKAQRGLTKALLPAAPLEHLLASAARKTGRVLRHRRHQSKSSSKQNNRGNRKD